MRTSTLALAIVLVSSVATSALVACSTNKTGERTDSSEAFATDAEIALAKAAQDLISGDHAHCNQCHTAGRADVKRWGENMLTVAQDCFTGTMTAAERVACMSDDPSNPSSGFSAEKLGLFSAGANRLQALFMQADPTGGRFAKFKAASMPVGNSVPAMTSAEFQKIIDWVFAGMPAFNDVFGGPPEPAPCVASISSDLETHINTMKTEGWAARLADLTTPMFGCGAATTPTGCLSTFPLLIDPWGAAGVDQTLRVLQTMPTKTSYWIRSSADGRFVGFGQFTAAGILDLQAPAGSDPIKVDARYDPSFFPNNDGVSFAGTGLATEEVGPIKVCRQSVLTAIASQPNPTLTLNETGCSSIVNTVYQSVGASLDGATFWMSAGAHVNDDGGNQITHPLEGFEDNARTFLIPMVNDGVSYKPKPVVVVNTPFEGDQMLSPSSRLLVTRQGSKPDTRGYKIRRLTTTITPGTSSDGGTSEPTISASTDVIGTICGGGGKVMVSFDERFVVTHQYSDPDETDSGLPDKSSNIILWDLKTGDRVRVTTMGANQYALYPHFRADGWLYFLVRDMNPGAKETLVATDVAIKRAAL